MNSTVKTALLWVVIIVLVFLLWSLFQTTKGTSETIAFSQFLDRVNQGYIESVVIHADDIRGPWSAPVALNNSRIDPGHIVGEDVRLEPDLVLCAIDRRDQRGEIFRAVAQQPDRIAGHEAVHRGARMVYRVRSSSVAASAAWSDMRLPGNA